jgi:hypothetical protein
MNQTRSYPTRAQVEALVLQMRKAGISYSEAVQQFRKQFILTALGDFNWNGDQYFLSQVWSQADREVYQCSKCRMEQTLMAQAGRRQLVVIAAKQ